MERLAFLPTEHRQKFIEGLSDEELSDQRLWLRPSQLRVVDDPAPVILDLRGRGAGKTRTGASWVIEKAKSRPGTRIHLVGRTAGDVRDVMIQGPSGIMSLSSPHFMPLYHPTIRKIVWPNGSQALAFSGEEPDQLRGPQANHSWVDELGAFRMKPDSSGLTAWDNVVISTRLGAKPQVLATTTPRKVRVIRDLLKQATTDPRISIHTGSTFDNMANLSPDYIENLMRRYAGTALERQELGGELVLDAEGALWRTEDIRMIRSQDLPWDDIRIVVIGVDPGVTTGGDATGIVVVGATMERDLSKRRCWVLSDVTEEGLSPERWSARVVSEWRWWTDLGKGRWATVVVAEKNQGGELVRTVLDAAAEMEDVKIPIGLVHASRNKSVRAEPVVLAYRRGQIDHIDWIGPPPEPDELHVVNLGMPFGPDLSEMEREMTEWEPKAGWSPNRMDAMVWALRALVVDRSILAKFGEVSVSKMTGEIPLTTIRRGPAGLTTSWSGWRPGAWDRHR